MRYQCKCRQSEEAADVVRRLDRIIKVIQQERKPDAAQKRHQKRDKNIAIARRPDRLNRCDGVRRDLDIVRPAACDLKFLLLQPLRVCIEQRPVRFDLTLQRRQTRLCNSLNVRPRRFLIICGLGLLLLLRLART